MAWPTADCGLPSSTTRLAVGRHVGDQVALVALELAGHGLMGVDDGIGRAHAGGSQRIAAAGDGASEEGVRIAVELIEAMRKEIQGIYLMPAFGRYDLAAEIIESVRASR